MILHLFITLPLISYSNGQLHITCFDSGESARYCLSYINKNASWENAASYCRERNGTLAMLEDINILSRINSSLEHTSINTVPCWVGGYRHDSKWIWLNGNPITQTHGLHGNGSCTLLNLKAGAILNYHCDKDRPFICQFNIENYTFCPPGVSKPNGICYTYVKNYFHSSWCLARESCFARGGDLASLDHNAEIWGKFLMDAQATKVFVGAALNLTKWQWLNGNNITFFNNSLLEISSSVYHCVALISHGSFALLPIQCNHSENFSFICEVDPENTTSQNTSLTSVCAHRMHVPVQANEPMVSTANSDHTSHSPVWSTYSQTSPPEKSSAAFISRSTLIEIPIMSSEKGNVAAGSITFNNLQIVSYGSPSKSLSSHASLMNPISIPVPTSSFTNPTEKSSPQLSKSPTKSSNSTTETVGQESLISEQAIVLGASIGGEVFVIATILIIILHKRRQLSAKRTSMSRKGFSEGAHPFPMEALSRDLDHEPTFIENHLYEATNISS